MVKSLQYIIDLLKANEEDNLEMVENILIKDNRKVSRGAHATVYHFPEENKVLKINSFEVEREVEVLQRLHGLDFVPNLYDYGYSFIVMDFVEGKSLHELEEEGFDYSDDSFWLQLFNILKQLQANGVEHGDMNAGNILLTEDGSINLIDFGNYSPREEPEIYIPMFLYGLTSSDMEKYPKLIEMKRLMESMGMEESWC